MAPTVECAKCHKEIQADGKNLVCADCTSAYHLGKNCSGVGDSTFTTMGQAKRENRDNPPALNPTPCSPSTDTDSLKAQLSSMNKKLEALLSLKESVDALQTIPTRLNELLLLKPIVEGLTTTVRDVQASIADFSGKYDILLKAATSNTQAVKTLQDEVSSLQATVQSQAAEILQVRAAQNDKGAADVTHDAISQSDSTLLATQITAMSQKLDTLSVLKTSVDALLELPGQVEQLLLLKPSIDQMKASIEEVRTLITSLEKNYDSLLASVSAHTTDINDLRTEVEALKATVTEQAAAILSLRMETNEAEQNSRRQNMEIHGLKVTSGEAPVSIVAGLAAKLGI
ncbi:hypothetical protein HPB47_003850, partial [Ixodes persulcatus]